MKVQKNYFYVFDPSTYLYSGLTHEKTANSTDVKPHFEAGFKTIYDKKLKKWKLIDEREYFELMSSMNKQLEFETDIKLFIGNALVALGKDVHTFCDKFDINNADRYVGVRSLATMRFDSIEKDIKHVEKRVDDVYHRVLNLTTTAVFNKNELEQIQKSINNLATSINYIKFELDLPWYSKLYRFLTKLF